MRGGERARVREKGKKKRERERERKRKSILASLVVYEYTLRRQEEKSRGETKTVQPQVSFWRSARATKSTPSTDKCEVSLDARFE